MNRMMKNKDMILSKLDVIIRYTGKTGDLTIVEAEMVGTCIDLLRMFGLFDFQINMLAEAWPDADRHNFIAWQIKTSYEELTGRFEKLSA